MKKIKMFIIPILCFMLVVSTAAYSSSNGVYEYENENSHIVVTFSEDSALTAEQQQLISDRLVYGDPGIQTYAWCWLVGHKLTYDTVSVVTHKKSATSPRCYEEIYNVASCSNCDHIEQELLSATYIVCCD